MSKFTKTPGSKETTAPQQSASDFISGADSLPNTESYTWFNLDDTKRRGGNFNIRFTDAELEKLKFISKNTPFSMQQFCISVLRPAIEAKVTELTTQVLRQRQAA
jgi:hypothetical protein